MHYRVSQALDPAVVAEDQRILDELGDYTGPGKHLVTMGGDGTLLNAVHEVFVESKHSIPIIPLNYGTRGYLTNRRMDPWDMVQKVAADRGFKYVDFDMLAWSGTSDKGCDCHSQTGRAFNEFALMASTGQSGKFIVRVDDVPVANEPIIASGVCVATSQGSTGLAYSANGPAVVPGISCLVLQFLLPYHPRFSTMVLPFESTVTIELVDSDYRRCNITYDGRSEPANGNFFLVRRHHRKAKVAYLKDHDFQRRMIGKIIR